MAYSLMDAAALVPDPFEDEGASAISSPASSPAERLSDKDDGEESDRGLAYMELDDFISKVIVPPEEQRNELVGTFKDFVSFYSTKFGAEDDVRDISRGALASLKQVHHLKEEAAKESHEGENIIIRLIKKGLIRLVKWVLKKTLKSVVKFIWWAFRRIVVTSVEGLLEWVVRPVLIMILGFIGVNPELWPVVAIAGGVAALGWGAYKVFFSDASADNVKDTSDEEKEHLTEQRSAAMAGVETVNLKPEPTKVKLTDHVPEAKHTTQTKAHARPSDEGPSGAAAPMAAGAPVTGDDKSVKAMIMRHEGFKTKPYKDSLGLWTIGVGHLIGNGKTLPPDWDREFSMAEVNSLFDQDYAVHKAAAMKIPNFNMLNASGQGALIDLTFNMGPVWWHKWHVFTKAMQDGNIGLAADSLQDSTWYKQVGKRAVEVVALLRSGSNGTSTQAVGDQARVGKGTTMAAQSQSAGQVANQSPTGSILAPVDDEGIVIKKGKRLIKVAA